MSLTAVQLRARDGRLTASRVGVLMNGDEADILDLWHEMVGDPAHEEEDFERVWYVRLGEVTETLQLDWYALITGRRVTRRGDVVVHPGWDWAASTLDGWDDHLGCPVECKHVNGFEKREDVVARYWPQCHWQMMCTGAARCMLSMIEGARQPVIVPVDFDGRYAADLAARAEAFMQCVWDLTPPVALPGVAPGRSSPEWRTFDLDALATAGVPLPNWAGAILADMDTWEATKPSAKQNADAAKTIKDLLPADVGLVKRGRVTIKRARNNAIHIKLPKED